MNCTSKCIDFGICILSENNDGNCECILNPDLIVRLDYQLSLRSLC